jgi:hypothetical protein
VSDRRAIQLSIAKANGLHRTPLTVGVTRVSLRRG